MTKEKSNPAYYSAPVLPTREENPFFDPLMDIPGLDTKETKPGDIFRTTGQNSSLIQQPSGYDDSRPFPRFKGW